MQFIVESKTYIGGNWIDLPEKICSGLERAKDHAREIVSNANIPTKARVSIRDADKRDQAFGFERDADGRVSER
jgi:hypothetical protein